jgi:hypothetical protein
MFAAYSRSFSVNRIVLSAYCRIEIPPSTRCGTSPLACPSSFALFINVDNISTTRLKSKGDNGSPYLKPFFV